MAQIQPKNITSSENSARRSPIQDDDDDGGGKMMVSDEEPKCSLDSKKEQRVGLSRLPANTMAAGRRNYNHTSSGRDASCGPTQDNNDDCNGNSSCNGRASMLDSELQGRLIMMKISSIPNLEVSSTTRKTSTKK
mmetsp:Transcript_35833/g.75459  ORF Transcript_35833/g.75459 Transcript_35833/m.75459 type:complete len:135 (+) Transcript_35833:52-456(+)